MPGTKRSWEGAPLQPSQNPIPVSNMSTADFNPILSIFTAFRNELDEHHDRRERLIKTSRDITALSKKIIFSLQRIRTLNAPLPAPIAKESSSRFDQITSLFASTVPDTQGVNRHRYHYQLSPGIQEFIEALTFSYYLTEQRLLRLDEVRARIPDVLVTEEDYAMGVFDLTGEIMRFAIMALSLAPAPPPPAASGGGSSALGGDGVDEGLDSSSGGDSGGGGGGGDPQQQHLSRKGLAPAQAGIVVDLREVRALFQAITLPRRYGGGMFRDMGKKMEVMQNSVEKVERAAYGILVRGSERPVGWMPDLSSSAVVVGES